MLSRLRVFPSAAKPEFSNGYHVVLAGNFKVQGDLLVEGQKEPDLVTQHTYFENLRSTYFQPYPLFCLECLQYGHVLVGKETKTNKNTGLYFATFLMFNRPGAVLQTPLLLID